LVFLPGGVFVIEQGNDMKIHLQGMLLTTVSVGLLLAVASVTPVGAQTHPQAPTRVQVPVDAAAGRSVPSSHPTAPQQALPSPLATSQLEEGQRPELREQTLSLSFGEPIRVRELLLLLVRDTGLSVVADPDVDGTFIGELKNVTLRQALELILQPLGFEFSLQDNIIRVFKRQMQTRIFNINYVATRRSGTRGVSATSSAQGANGGFGTSGFGMGGFGGGSSGFGGNTGSFGGNGAGGSMASVSATDSSDLFQDLERGLATLLSGEGKFNMDRKAGLMQVTDYPDRLDKVALYLEAVETRVQRQVAIQAKVIEVELNDSYSGGINWNNVFSSANNAVSVTQRLAPTSSQGAFTIGVNIRSFTGLLDAFATQGKVNVISSPRVTAMNNEPAVMRVGTQDVFFVTNAQVDATTGRILQTVVTPQQITEGVVLSVTPQISADGIITMSITPSITERTGQAISRLGDTVPIVSVRETDTLVRVREGETIVIGGLMQERTTVDKTKVPILGDVPLVGGLFRRDEKTRRKTDLVILLTPTLMTPSEIVSQAIRDQQRLYEEQKAPVKK
jgi:MSHA biogenesis protein MshL